MIPKRVTKLVSLCGLAAEESDLSSTCSPQRPLGVGQIPCPSSFALFVGTHLIRKREHQLLLRQLMPPKTPIQHAFSSQNRGGWLTTLGAFTGMALSATCSCAYPVASGLTTCAPSIPVGGLRPARVALAVRESGRRDG